MTTLPLTTFWDTAKTEGEANLGWFQTILARMKETGSGESFPTYTIATGVISPTVGYFDVATEGAASSDDLSQISITAGTTWTEGSLIILRANNDAQTVVLKHESGGSGQLSLTSGSDVILDTNKKWAAFILNGTTWEEIRFIPPVNVINGTIRNLVGSRPSVSTVTIAADEITLTDGNNIAYVARSVSQTPDIAVSGLGGLDTGTEAASTWYYIWIIATPTGTQGSIFSTSATSPTMPSGYTYKSLVGVVYNDSGSDFVTYYQTGKNIIFAPTTAISGATATTYTSVSLTAIIPPIAKGISGNIKSNDPTSGNSQIYVASKSTGEGEKIGWQNPATGNGGIQSVPFTLPIIEAQTIYYKVESATDTGEITISEMTI